MQSGLGIACGYKFNLCLSPRSFLGYAVCGMYETRVWGNELGAGLVSHVEKVVLGPGSLRGGAVFSAWLWFHKSGGF